MIPKLTKLGYQTEPEYSKICRMAPKQLSAVNNFTIMNKFGSIKFETATDLSYLNLNKIVNIEHKCIELYSQESVNKKPAIGSGLNKPAILTYKNILQEHFSEENSSDEEFVLAVKKWAKNQNLQYILSVSYTHLTLPTKRIVQISVVAGSLKIRR
eukprot:TRINITY_DN19523_c0_g1_i1.p3 TRINITY_DN19523_c0_g1~~TRINITY_DN19523_c0_g1_i1.p3  ORF type:complete len:156 (-),score=35.44 TRINITY_DN19523_c0_g1_i1:69-536(-)